MKLSNLVYAAIGYTLGARAGRERYEAIVRLARRFAGSQTVQSTAGVVQAQVDQLTHHARQALTAKVGGGPSAGTRPHSSVNGHRAS